MSSTKKRMEIPDADFARRAPWHALDDFARQPLSLEQIEHAVADQQVRMLISVRVVAMKCRFDFDELLERSLLEWKDHLG